MLIYNADRGSVYKIRLSDQVAKREPITKCAVQFLDFKSLLLYLGGFDCKRLRDRDLTDLLLCISGAFFHTGAALEIRFSGRIGEP